MPEQIVVSFCLSVAYFFMFGFTGCWLHSFGTDGTDDFLPVLFGAVFWPISLSIIIGAKVCTIVLGINWEKNG